jgi:SAM-dependent methyltransferase
VIHDPDRATLKDRFNLEIDEAPAAVDAVNKAFYGRFTYPWPPAAFERFADEGLWRQMLNQDLGCWRGDRVPDGASVWVAGCGTNQAVFTALRLPHARVLGTDLSTQSLATARTSADQLGLTNLELVERSIHETDFREQFDYVACTGVIHHNADPPACLARLAAALKPGGVMELMVYNYFHRFLTTAYQKAVRTLAGGAAELNFERELAITRTLIGSFPVRNLMGGFLQQQRGIPDAGLADALLQPVEYSYTVESIAAMADACGLDVLLPCITPYDRAARRIDWNVSLGDPALDREYENLPDLQRWQIGNLLLFNDSPMVWFYLQRKDSPHARHTERDVCAAFLETRFARASSSVRKYVLKDDRREPGPDTPFPDPAAPADPAAAQVLAKLDSSQPIGETIRSLGLDMSFRSVNRLRIQLTTTAFPYLRAKI